MGYIVYFVDDFSIFTSYWRETSNFILVSRASLQRQARLYFVDILLFCRQSSQRRFMVAVHFRNAQVTEEHAPKGSNFRSQQIGLFRRFVNYRVSNRHLRYQKLQNRGGSFGERSALFVGHIE